MLVLSRKLQEAIVIRDDIVVRVLEVNRDTVKLGIDAPPEMPVHRLEVHNAPVPEPKRKRSKDTDCPPRRAHQSRTR